jgi:hypothetical protein
MAAGSKRIGYHPSVTGVVEPEIDGGESIERVG